MPSDFYPEATLSEAQKSQIRQFILPGVSEETLSRLYDKIEILWVFDLALNQPRGMTESELAKKVNQLKGRLDATLRLLEEIGGSFHLENLDEYYFHANSDDSMRHRGSQLRSEAPFPQDLEQAREYFSISGTVDTLSKIQRAVTHWQHINKPPGRKTGRPRSDKHYQLIAGIAQFFEDNIPSLTPSSHEDTAFYKLISFLFTDSIDPNLSDPWRHIRYALERRENELPPQK